MIFIITDKHTNVINYNNTNKEIFLFPKSEIIILLLV